MLHRLDFSVQNLLSLKMKMLFIVSGLRHFKFSWAEQNSLCVRNKLEVTTQLHHLAVQSSLGMWCS